MDHIELISKQLCKAHKKRTLSFQLLEDIRGEM